MQVIGHHHQRVTDDCRESLRYGQPCFVDVLASGRAMHFAFANGSEAVLAIVLANRDEHCAGPRIVIFGKS